MFKSIARQKVQISVKDKCPICKTPFLKDDKTLVQDIMATEVAGTVHSACFMPYHPEKDLKLLIQIRCYSIGDTIASTPVIRNVKQMYPDMKITVLTFFPDLFKYNPHVNAIIDANLTIPAQLVEAHTFKMDAFAGEQMHHFAIHSVNFAFHSAFDHDMYPNEGHYEVFIIEDDQKNAIKVLKEAGIDPDKDKVIAVHPHATEWETRDWGKHHMKALVEKLAKKYPDYKIISIGGKRGEVPNQSMKNYVELPKEQVIDLYGKLSLLESCALLDLPCIKLLVTPDTGTLHIGATAKELPIVGIFTLIRSYFRTPFRKGRFGYKFIGVEADTGCNCTYQTKLLTHQANFKICPKRTFLEKTLRVNLPKHVKAEGMKNYDHTRKWEPENIADQIRKEIVKFPSNNLPCFPTVDKVFDACQVFLNGS